MSNESKKLSGKVAVVTGASKGIGASIARHLAAAGAAVVVNYASSQQAAERVVEQITSAGGRAVAIRADLSVKSDIDRLFAETRSAFGRLDILVNNAGTYEFAPLAAIDEKHIHRQFDLNVAGLVLATQRAVELIGDSGGSVINIGSIVGSAPIANASVYSATKAAVDAITKSLAKELGPRRIRVNSLNPGAVETEGTHAVGLIGSDLHQSIVAATPLGRIGQPDDIGPVVVFLASDDAGWVSGETLGVAGGHAH